VSTANEKECTGIGYGQPPKAHQFKSGQSGNPKGRPKGVKNFSTDVAEELAEKIPVTEHGKAIKITKQRALIKALLSKALKGDSRAASQLIALTPLAEKAREAKAAEHSLSPNDQQLLDVLRGQLIDEMKHGIPGETNPE
jgi:hypothetical protein